MKRFLFTLFSALTVLFLIVGCSNDSNSSTPTEEETSEVTDEAQEQSVLITISLDEEKEIITEKEVEIEENAILMDVMKENFDSGEDGGFIYSIEGIEPEEDEKKAWMFFVNGEMAEVGAADYELSPGDHVVFDLQSWE